MMFEFAEEVERLADIKVVGAGGAGGNAVGRMIEAGLSGVEFLAINTDVQALHESKAHHAMQIGAQLTKGLGSGGLPATGQAAAEEDRDTIAAALQGADMVFVTAGMGGGTGTGSASVIADIARGQGALTVGIVTKPFNFEGEVRMSQALDGIARLREAVDTLIVIPNQRLMEVALPSTTMQEAFGLADNVLYEATRGIFEIISRHDHVNLDFADVRSVMTGMGEAMMGTGRAVGENRAVEAARAAISSPLLEDVDIAGSKAVLVNVLGKEVGLMDTAQAMEFIQKAAGPQAHVIFGYGQDDSMDDTLQITVIATGFQGCDQQMPDFAAAHVVAESEVSEMMEPVDQEDWYEGDTQASAEIETEEANQQPYSDQENDYSSDFDGGFQDDSFHEEPLNLPEELPEDYEEEFSEHSDYPAARVDMNTEPENSPATEQGFLTRPAAEDQPHEDDSFNSAAEVDYSGESDTEPSQRFLRPVGRRLIGEVEVPDNFVEPEPVSRSTASGLGPDHGPGDLNSPAYTRKYMD